MDIINSLFEFFAGIFIFLNIKKILKDKEVHGISWVSVLFFTLWGLWNLFYYPFLGQYFSFLAGILIFVSNLIYTGLLIYYQYFYEISKG